MKSLIPYHLNLSISHEAECNGSLAFLDILMTRRLDGTLQRKIHRKATWSGRYLQFSSFVPVAYKRGLVRTLFHRARNICTEDQLEKEEEFIKQTLQANGYPESFIERHRQQKNRAEPVHVASKKQVVIFLPFKGDHVFNQINHNLKSALKRSYMAAELRLLQTTKGLCLKTHSIGSNQSTASHVIYQFTCSCGDTYIGRTDRCLAQRVSEHIPKWLVQRMTQPRTSTLACDKNPASSITKHLMKTGHKVDLTQSFKVLLRNRTPRLLAFCEALLITTHRPPLCSQKKLTHNVCLPWH